jgi:hypothetical protein
MHAARREATQAVLAVCRSCSTLHAILAARTLSHHQVVC